MTQSNVFDATALAIGGGTASWNFMSVNSVLALIVAVLTVVLLSLRIVIAWRALKLEGD